MSEPVAHMVKSILLNDGGSVENIEMRILTSIAHGQRRLLHNRETSV